MKEKELVEQMLNIMEEHLTTDDGKEFLERAKKLSEVFTNPGSEARLHQVMGEASAVESLLIPIKQAIDAGRDAGFVFSLIEKIARQKRVEADNLFAAHLTLPNQKN